MADMSDLLTDRYSARYVAYECADAGVAAFLRGHIDRLDTEGRPLRPDAKLLLLSLFDQMIYRPYAGPIWSIEGESLGTRMPEVVERHELGERISHGFVVIVEGLAEISIESPISGHAILRVIDAKWKELVNIFGWA